MLRADSGVLRKIMKKRTVICRLNEKDFLYRKYNEIGE